MNSKKKKNARPEPSMMGAIRAIPVGLAAFGASALLTALVASVIAYATPDPGKYVFPFGLAALYLSSGVGGFVARKRSGGLSLLTGALCGIAQVAVALIISLIIPESLSAGLSPVAVFCTRLPTVGISVIGAYLASTKPKKKHRRKNHR